MDDIFDRVIIAGVILITIVVVLAGIAAIFENLQEYRSVPNQVVCRQKQMESIRQTFHSNVACVPAIARRDTIYVQH